MKKIISVMLSVSLCLVVALIFPQLSKSYMNVDDTGCLTCHIVGDAGGTEGLHGESGHISCTQCHEGTPGPGTVQPSACIVCHPTGDAGQCSLVNTSNHGSICLTCHAVCATDGDGDGDGDGDDSDTIPCTSEAIYGEDSEEVELLREYRDNVLSKTPEGRKLIDLYYKLSPVIVPAIENSDVLKAIAKKRIDNILESIR